jgi:hypothetical protein
MKNYFILFTFLYMLLPSAMNGAVYKGHQVFIQVCTQCHTSGNTLVSKNTIYEWRDLMKNNGAKLAMQHLKEERAKQAWRYFQSRKFEKKTGHLEDFVVEYAKDSGNVPACN